MTVNSTASSLSQGDTVNLQIPLYSSGTTPAALISPTGYYIIAKTVYDTVVLLTKTATFTESSGLWTMAVQLTTGDTANLPAGTLYQQATVFDTDGSVETVLASTLTVNAAIPESVAINTYVSPTSTAAQLAALLSAGGASSPLGIALAALLPSLPPAPTSGVTTLWSDAGVPVVSQG